MAAVLEGVELVEGLDVLAVEVGSVAHDLLEIFGFGDAQSLAETDFVLRDVREFAFPDGTLAEGLRGPYVVMGPIHVVLGCYGLKVVDAAHLPEVDSDALGEHRFEVSFGLEALEYAGDVRLPFGRVFGFIENDGDGEYAVLQELRLEMALARREFGPVCGMCEYVGTCAGEV